MWVVCPRREKPPRRIGAQQLDKTWHTTSHACQTPDQRSVSLCIQCLPLQAEDGKDRHRAWLMLTTAAMWEQRGGRVEWRCDATGRLADKWDHPQQGDDGPAWSLAGSALTEIKFTIEISLFCKLTERCHKLRFDKVRIRSHSIK